MIHFDPNDDEIDRRAKRNANHILRRVSEGAHRDLMLDNLTGVDADLKPLIRAYLGLPVEPEPVQRVYQPVLRRRAEPTPQALEKAGGRRVRVFCGVGVAPRKVARSSVELTKLRAPRPTWQIRLFEGREALWRSHMPDIEVSGPEVRWVGDVGTASRRSSVPGGITKSVPKERIKK